MAVSGQNIVDEARGLLQDTVSGNYRWSDADQLIYINDCQLDIALLRPELSASLADLTLVAGSKQTIGVTYLRLLRVVRDTGTNGTTAGDAIVTVDRDILDVFVPGWHAITGVATPKFAVHDPIDPKTFYVCPPQPSTGNHHIEALCSVVPTALASLANNIVFPDTYKSAFVDYVLFRAYLREAEHAISVERANTFLQSFTAKITAGSQADMEAALKTLRQKYMVAPQ